MALEDRFKPNGGIHWNPFHQRWPIHHEPLRADARALLPQIEQEIFPSQRLKRTPAVEPREPDVVPLDAAAPDSLVPVPGVKP